MEDILVILRFSIIKGWETRNNDYTESQLRDPNPVKKGKIKDYIIPCYRDVTVRSFFDVIR